MFSTISETIKKYKIALVIGIIFFILPFFWLKPGEMDLGGDGNRLYFYDPITYLTNTNFYSVSIEGMGMVESRYFEIPYVVLISILKFLLYSPTFVISFINGLKLAVAFFAIYLIVHKLAKQIYPANSKYTFITAILAGIFYIVLFGSIHINFEWNTALTEHNQIFLNPLIFYLLFMLLLTNSYKYLWTALLISFIFAPNFSYGAVSPFFAFYPLAFLFLVTYIKFFLKKPILWKGICVGFVLFLGIHASHLLSQVSSIFDSSSTINTRVFSQASAQQDGMNYFTAVSPNGMAILNLLLPSENRFLSWTSFISPVVLIIGFIVNKKKEFLFISFFFFLTFFLVTANITHIGFELYKSFFYIPVFGMFRVFYVKWIYVFLFFYSLLFGISIYNILLKLKSSYGKIFYLSVFILLVITGIPLFLGKSVNSNIVRGSNNVKSILKMDPRFEQTLQFIRSLPDNGKFLVVPLTDFNYQLFYGNDRGAYAGVPAVRHLTGKYGFYGDRNFGWQTTDPVRYAEEIKKYAREKNYDRLLRIFTTLNIRYIFHNADPKIYEENFSRFEGPYAYIKSSLPATQQGYRDFIHQFPVRLIYKNGTYNVYELDKSVYNPTIFIPQGSYQSNKLSFDRDKAHSVFIDSSICEKDEFKKICGGAYKVPSADISFKMINPTLYALTVQAHEKIDSLLLVMQHTFHRGWKLIIDGKKIPESQHIPVNGYANGWRLFSKDMPKSEKYTLFIQLDPQKYFWFGWTITSISLTIVISLFVYSLFSRLQKEK